MNFSIRCFATLLTGALLFSPAVAFADDADKAACASLEEGDDCTRGDGDPGVCSRDESDANVLTCDDDAIGSGSGGSDDGSSGCSASGHAEGSIAGVLLALGALLTARARRPLAARAR
ncbi:MAG: hypothetical protein HOV80_11150 [Polyangiaceae bacterium]|nr:hypothetical protein [Polyangiaceae bacterium]